MDSVQLSLHEAYNFEIAMAVAVAGAHAALSRRPVLFVVCLAATLTMNEPAAMFMLIAPPLLSLHVGGTRPARLLRHGALWVAVALAVLLARWLIGDPWGAERVGEIMSAPSDMFARGRRSAFVGFGTFGSLLVERLRQPLQEADGGIVVAAVSCGLLALAALSWLQWRSGRPGASGSEAPRARGVALEAMGAAMVLVLYCGWLIATHARAHVARTTAACGIVALVALGWHLWRSRRAAVPAHTAQVSAPRAVTLMAAGLTTMLAMYFTYFRAPWYPADHRTGCYSAVHAAPAVGAALLAAGLAHAALSWLPRRARWATLLAVAMGLGLLGGFGEIMQREYEASWLFQQDFWRSYRHLCRDATDNTLVLVSDRDLPKRRFIQDFSWGSEFLPDLLFSYHEMKIDTRALQRPPVVILIGHDPTKPIRREGAMLQWIPAHDYFKLGAEQPEDGNIIVLERRNNQWRRIDGVVPIEGGTLTLRPVGGDLLDSIPLTPLAKVYMP